MENPFPRSSHTFHVPVMGIGFSIDSALRVAKYGISSVMSLVDDTLIEQVRKYHCEQENEPYEEISLREEDARARRITAYLNLLDKLVARSVAELQASPFEPGSEITRYYEMLPASPLKQRYLDMLACESPEEKKVLQEALRPLAVPGSIDANIMSHASDGFRAMHNLPQEYNDALAGLRGFANSTVRSSLIFSAGMNPYLYTYIAEFADFFPDADGVLKKQIVLKVSDYRSAVIQGRFLAKKGLWVSEYRIESGLNCGGHAYATKGLLLGPILEEFTQQKETFVQKLHKTYNKAIVAAGRPAVEQPHEVRITAQGGIGTPEEDALLRESYSVYATGWATPFLLVPEVVNVDPCHLERLVKATEKDISLSDNSPFGLPFWNLHTSASEEARCQRIEAGKPGSLCHKTHVRFNTEFTDVPICTASRAYQKKKLEHLAEEGLTPEQFERVREHVLAKSCICHDLGGGAMINYGIDTKATPAVCPGPNIADFSKVATLEEMIDHIYGRALLPVVPGRPHMFIREITIYTKYLRDEIELCRLGLLSRPDGYFAEYRDNMLLGIEYYRELVQQHDKPESPYFNEQQREQFLRELAECREELVAVVISETTKA